MNCLKLKSFIAIWGILSSKSRSAARSACHGRGRYLRLLALGWIGGRLFVLARRLLRLLGGGREALVQRGQSVDRHFEQVEVFLLLFFRSRRGAHRAAANDASGARRDG